MLCLKWKPWMGRSPIGRPARAWAGLRRPEVGEDRRPEPADRCCVLCVVPFSTSKWRVWGAMLWPCWPAVPRPLLAVLHGVGSHALPPGCPLSSVQTLFRAVLRVSSDLDRLREPQASHPLFGPRGHSGLLPASRLPALLHPSPGRFYLSSLLCFYFPWVSSSFLQ